MIGSYGLSTSVESATIVRVRMTLGRAALLDHPLEHLDPLHAHAHDGVGVARDGVRGDDRVELGDRCEEVARRDASAQ